MFTVMIKTPQEFEDEVAWERTLLGLALPLASLSSSYVNLDLRTGHASAVASSSMSGDAVERMRNAMLPLLFGAAWKILDLAVELALTNDPRVKKPNKRWSIDYKVKEIKTSGILPGISQSPNVWAALRGIYGATTEPRHALVHRRVKIDPMTRELIPFDENGNSLTPLSEAEQVAFVRFAQRLADTVVTGCLGPRASADLEGQLSVLQRHHKFTMPVGLNDGPPVRVRCDFPADNRIDVPSILDRARQVFPSNPLVDLELVLPDGRSLLAELDQAPREVITVDPDALPNWMRFTYAPQRLQGCVAPYL